LAYAITCISLLAIYGNVPLEAAKSLVIVPPLYRQRPLDVFKFPDIGLYIVAMVSHMAAGFLVSI